jgi:hypothetical protein
MVEMYRGPEATRQPTAYRVRRAPVAPRALLAFDGWDAAMAVTWGPPGLTTTFRALWTPMGVGVRWDAQDRAPWATCTQRDDRLWETEVVEVFIDPTRSGEDYAELEITPTNVVCDLRIEQLSPERIVHLDWDFPGLETAVQRADEGDDWSAAAWMPFAGFAALSPRVAACLPVACGDIWHLNVFRIKRPGGPGQPEAGAIYAAWSVPDGPTFHAPQAFRPMVFEAADAAHPLLPAVTDRDLLVRHTADGWRVDDGYGRPICETLASIAEARLIGRTCVSARGRVWLRDLHGWVVLDDD